MKLLKVPAYIRFLICKNKSDLLSSQSGLDGIERQLLNYIALNSAQGKKLLVGDLIRLCEFGSQTTLHGRIKNLSAQDFIELTQDISDGRKKYVTPTAKALKYYEKLSICLNKALENS